MDERWIEQLKMQAKQLPEKQLSDGRRREIWSAVESQLRDGTRLESGLTSGFGSGLEQGSALHWLRTTTGRVSLGIIVIIAIFVGGWFTRGQLHGTPPGPLTTTTSTNTTQDTKSSNPPLSPDEKARLKAAKKVVTQAILHVQQEVKNQFKNDPSAPPDVHSEFTNWQFSNQILQLDGGFILPVKISKTKYAVFYAYQSQVYATLGQWKAYQIGNYAVPNPQQSDAGTLVTVPKKTPPFGMVMSWWSKGDGTPQTAVAVVDTPKHPNGEPIVLKRVGNLRLWINRFPLQSKVSIVRGFDANGESLN